MYKLKMELVLRNDVQSDACNVAVLNLDNKYEQTIRILLPHIL